MRGVRHDLGLLQLTAAGVIKRLHQLRIARKAFRGCHVFHAVLFPQAIRSAKGSDTGLCGDPRAGKDYDSGFFHHF